MSPDLGKENAQIVVIEPSITADGPQIVTITNDYPLGELVLSKEVLGEAVGTPVEGGGAVGDGPFTVAIECVFPAGRVPARRVPPAIELSTARR